ncbi:serine hydrolase domain-containing protein [Streptomyces sp. URMC 123]|uniref:serine hydrolase domain-containing protein n=1 Tax=Streptomyces sp. URMC 123 TaxID=3423403 RepID=UPI003F1D1B71
MTSETLTRDRAPSAVQGTVAVGYEPVRETFAAVLAADPGHAAQLAAHVGGERVVDLWGGPGMTADCLLGVFSSTKGAAYLVTALLAQDGTLALDRTVRHYWPEFAAEGKGAITVRELLAHRAGVIGTDTGFAPHELADDRVIAERLARQRPYWRPGAAHGYHALVIGALIGELVYRTTGLTLQRFYDVHIRRTRALDFHLGLPAAEEHRVLDILPALSPADRGGAAEGAAEETAYAPDSLRGIAFNEHHPDAPALEALPNLRAVRAAGPASVGGVASARGLARAYAAAISTVDGRPPLLTPAMAAEAAQIHSCGHDLVLGEHRTFGLGFQTYETRLPFLGAGAFGHDGAGGSVAFADPRAALAFGYTRRRFPCPRGVGDDAVRLARAVRACATGGAADRPRD